MENDRKRKTAVIGAGNWGTALAKLLGDKGEDVVLWSHRPEHCAQLRQHRENRRYLPGYTLPPNIHIEENLQDAVDSCRYVVMVVPSHGFREVFSHIAPLLAEGTIVLSAVKGIENKTLATMTGIMADLLRRHGKEEQCRLGVLSGPSFADEVAARQPTAVTVAFGDQEAATEVQQLFSTDFFRAYTGDDVIGLEISSAMKNVVAIAAGISDGLGYGLNTRAALITRGLAEITRLGTRMGANPLTFLGLGGLGDLVLTCTGNLSRNRTVGLKLGEGKSLQQALAEMSMVAEGVRTTRSCYALSRKLEVEMPILEQTYQVLYEDKPARTAVRDLLGRSLKKELP